MGSGVNDYAGRVAARRRILVVTTCRQGSPGIAALVRELGDVSLQEVELRDEPEYLRVSEGPWHLVVFWLREPSGAAIGWLHHIRRRVGCAPIAVVAQGADAEVVTQLLDAGADDVVAGAISEPQVLARTTALLGAASGMYPATAAAAQLPQSSPEIALHGTELRVQGVPVHLTVTEAALVAALLERKRQWRTAAELLQKAFDGPMTGDTSLVRVHVFNIRKKLGGLAYCLQGRRGFGYRVI